MTVRKGRQEIRKKYLIALCCFYNCYDNRIYLIRCARIILKIHLSNRCCYLFAQSFFLTPMEKYIFSKHMRHELRSQICVTVSSTVPGYVNLIKPE